MNYQEAKENVRRLNNTADFWAKMLSRTCTNLDRLNTQKLLGEVEMMLVAARNDLEEAERRRRIVMAAGCAVGAVIFVMVAFWLTRT